ncbi:hypothetical protein MSG28_005093 [Choristoneura fumiferana]|uniref:Uncharacterized protein n=1 Tax=Choristoneura fumiferana TaxID=7141 RepID=A0ACC0JPR9_CHOFU|nr:hypothetical protein MSG28_005093 [Choristoneura fumiferana]
MSIPLGRDTQLPTQMEKDTTNYMQHKLGFSKNILLTNEAVPSKFHCQKDRKRLSSDDETAQEVFLKRKRIELVRECLQSQSATETQNERLKIDDDIVQEIIKPEEILRTQDKDTVTDSIITAEKSVQARIKRNVHYRSKAIQTICQSKSITTSPLKGFGGRTSDVTIVENSKFLDELQIGSCILADRGFKHLEQKLHEKAMKLLRPPSSAPNFCLSSSLLYQKRPGAMRLRMLFELWRRYTSSAQIKTKLDYVEEYFSRLYLSICGEPAPPKGRRPDNQICRDNFSASHYLCPLCCACSPHFITCVRESVNDVYLSNLQAHLVLACHCQGGTWVLLERWSGCHVKPMDPYPPPTYLYKYYAPIPYIQWRPEADSKIKPNAKRSPCLPHKRIDVTPQLCDPLKETPQGVTTHRLKNTDVIANMVFIEWAAGKAALVLVVRCCGANYQQPTLSFLSGENPLWMPPAQGGPLLVYPLKTPGETPHLSAKPKDRVGQRAPDYRQIEQLYVGCGQMEEFGTWVPQPRDENSTPCAA